MTETRVLMYQHHSAISRAVVRTMKNARQLAGQINYRVQKRRPTDHHLHTGDTPSSPTRKKFDIILLPSRILLEVFAIYRSCLCHIEYSLSDTEETLCQGADCWI